MYHPNFLKLKKKNSLELMSKGCLSCSKSHLQNDQKAMGLWCEGFDMQVVKIARVILPHLISEKENA